jgi:hypothetical protein
MSWNRTSGRAGRRAAPPAADAQIGVAASSTHAYGALPSARLLHVGVRVALAIANERRVYTSRVRALRLFYDYCSGRWHQAYTYRACIVSRSK